MAAANVAIFVAPMAVVSLTTNRSDAKVLHKAADRIHIERCSCVFHVPTGQREAATI
jgi:hypothetical protein